MVKELKSRNVAFKASTAKDGTFKGYASVFGNVDSYGDIVAPGAFADSIKRIQDSGDPLPVLWQHMSSQPIGGSDVLSEDDHGLKTDGFLLIDDIPQAKMAYSLLEKRVVKGLSIGYYVEASSYNEKTQINTLQKLDLVEYSIVTFPANELAQVESVKSILSAGKLPNMKDFERFLCEAGFSNTQAKAVAGQGLRKLLAQCEAEGETHGAVLSLLSNFKL